MAKCLELALNNGVDPRTGKKIGLSTGKFEDFKTYDEVVEAFKKQVRYLVDRRHILKPYQLLTFQRLTPLCFLPLLFRIA